MEIIQPVKSDDYCIVAIFLNESEIMEEWINHYIKEGCKKFFLIDNGSTDNYKDILHNMAIKFI
jgi:hypothetical protein